MKVEYKNNKIIIYLYRYKLDIHDVGKLNEEVKNIFIKLIKVHKMNFFGYSIVHVYENKKYGSILEIEKIYQNDFNLDIIDLKLIIHENTIFYLEMDDYLLDNEMKDMFIKNNKYYINIENIDNVMPFLEFGNIIYQNKID